MKSFLLLFALFITLYVSAQEHFPYKRPELLMGTTVTVLPLSKYHAFQYYQNYYADKSLSAYYKGGMKTPKEALENRKFRVLAVEQLTKEPASENFWITLKDETTGETVYHFYDAEMQSRDEYNFEVEGGLSLPADFYCDYITEMEFPDGGSRYSLKQSTFELVKTKVNGKATYTLSIKLYSSPSVGRWPLGIIGEDGSKVTLKNLGMYVVGKKTYTGGDITVKELEAISKFKPVSIEYGDKTQVFIFGELLQNGIPCMLSKP